MPQRPDDLMEVLPAAAPFLERALERADAGSGDRSLVLVHTLSGEFDAARAGTVTGAHLLATLPRTDIARFDADSLVDYRARRPRMTFTGDRYADVDLPEIVLSALEDSDGHPFLLLHGPEPDFHWRRFVAAVGELGRRVGVTSIVALHAVPMPVPHTRPVTLTAHASRRGLIDGYPLYWGEIQIPGSVGALLELRSGENGTDAFGFAAHVPHYLAQATFPAASLTLLDHLGRVTGLRVPTGALELAAATNRTEVDEQIARSSENTAVVAALEKQYDEFTAAHGGSGLLGGQQMPSADEIAGEFERFLAEQERRRGE